ncbi:hypothetical protein SERLADRAFT_462784 [Serpula lacrymans var. lacrymans S7.9]|uniref:Uncharacterized protein n=1 Tax=Serpula lacrymans var. lacrymans (strain S7.9) TaxID=578457 RepID=F8NQG7_SERL9|nr:uncharacterized protein SERLADRAFT_462784 [Serpula lacrymans var. lacrymans S7.9]EGO26097.1 hypothetical protein SERLADRAFT_462784 [Serpula lacrymans var. lacrymans S7.9]
MVVFPRFGTPESSFNDLSGGALFKNEDDAGRHDGDMNQPQSACKNSVPESNWTPRPTVAFTSSGLCIMST